MSSTRDIKRRIRSVKNTSQITKAMEVVSATKMRKSQAFALGARPYAVASLEILQSILSRTPSDLLPPLLAPREVKTACLVVVTSDKGLAGAFNANVLRKADAWLSAKPRTNVDIYADQRGHKNVLITVGKKAKEYFERKGLISASKGEYRDRIPVKSFFGYGDYSSLAQTQEVADAILAGFQDGSYDEVHAVYMNFRTTLVQEPVLKKILPASREGLEDAVRSILPEKGRYAVNDRGETSIEVSPLYNYEYVFEPSPAEILTTLVQQLIKMHIHHIILESNASEHSARMVAMKNASDNAKELMQGLSLAYNKARQANITRELVEITAGREALEA